MENLFPGIKNFSVAVKEKGNEVVFLRRIVPGGTDRSYGVHVAQLAGLPKKVVARADELLEEYVRDATAGQPMAIANEAKTAAPVEQEVSLFGNTLADEIKKLDIMTMTPLEALNELYKLQEEAKKEGGGK
jgi:DNA mismatch repair protein MutS